MSEPQEVFDILDGLTSPTADEVYTDVREYDTRDVLAAVGATAKAGGGGGGSQPWTEHDLSTLEADWTSDGVGTWTFVDGVISQTNATADSGVQMLLPVGCMFIVEAEVRFPSGQDSATTMKAAVFAGCPTFAVLGGAGTSISGGEGAMFRADGLGDGAGILLDAWCDGDTANGFSTTVAQGEWHTLRALVDALRQQIYLDGVYQFTDESPSGGNVANPGPPAMSNDQVTLAVTGLVDFRNVKVWTLALPA